MNTVKYLKRKYPNSYNEILNDFENETIDKYVKKQGFHIGRFSKDIKGFDYEYPKDTICFYKAIRVFDEEGKWDGSWDQYVIINAKEVKTASGYHSFTVNKINIKDYV